MTKMMMAVMAAMRWYPEKRPSVSSESIGAFIAVLGCHPGATVWSGSAIPTISTQPLAAPCLLLM